MKIMKFNLLESEAKKLIEEMVLKVCVFSEYVV